MDSIFQEQDFGNYPKLEADIHKDRAELLTRMGKYDQAEQEFQEAITFFRNDGDSTTIGHIYRGMSSLFRRTGDFPQALKYIQKAIELIRSENDIRFLASCYNTMGILYKDRQEWDKALEAYQTSLEYHEESDNISGQANALVNIGGINGTKGDEAEAIHYFKQALVKFSELNNQRAIAGISYNISIALKSQGNTEEALQYCLNSKRAFEATGTQTPPQIYTTLGELYAITGDKSLTQKYMRDGLKASRESGEARTIVNAYQVAASSFSELDLYKEAFDAHVKFKNISDSIYNIQMDEKFLELETSYKVKEKDSQIELLEEKQRQQKTRQIYILGILALAILALLLLWRNNLFRKRANRELAMQKKIIEEKNARNEILLREIHHRVKNNLQFISSLLNLQSEHVEDQNTLGVLQEGQDRVQSMALIHQSLYQDDNLVGISTKEYLEKLTTNLFESYNVSPDRIQLVLEIEDLNMDVDSMVPMGLIINELVSNALKYAFPGDEKGEIKVRLDEIDHQLLLSVVDNGIGIAEQDIDKLRGSFGYRLINAFSQQLNADLEIQNDQGTAVTLRIRKYKIAS